MVIEWAPFTLKPGVTETALLAASEELQRDFLARQSGFLRRELMRDGAQWTDLVYWDSRDALQQAMLAVAASPACQRYFALMAGADHANAGDGVTVLEVRASYQSMPRA
jgi:hypothetical protein